MRKFRSPVDASILSKRGTRYGFDAALPASGVLIHEFDPHREHKARLVSPLRGVVSGDPAGLFGGWGVGATFHDPTSGVTVRVEHQTTSGFVVTVDQSDFAFDGPDGALRMAVARAAAARSEAGIFCAEISRN